MSQIVFILGAGASRQCGGPLMSDFLDIARDLLATGKTGSAEGAFKEVFRVIGELQRVFSKGSLDIANIESIFTALELGKVLKKVPGLDDVAAIENAIECLKLLIVRTLELRISYPTNGQRIFAPEPYNSFGDLLHHLEEKAFPLKSVSVITFNYDLGADFAIQGMGRRPDYVLDSSATPSKAIPLLKLHGSLNWALEAQPGQDGQRKIVALYPGLLKVDAFSQTGETTLELSDHFKNYFRNLRKVDIEGSALIVPPSWNKSEYHRALTDVWASAARHLAEAEQIFVIGYSLPETDAFFRHLYSLGSVSDTVITRFVVCDIQEPEGGVDNRFREMLGKAALSRYEYRQTRFETAISSIKAMFPERDR